MKPSRQEWDSGSYDTITRLFAPLGKRACPIYRQVGTQRREVIGTAVPIRSQKYAALLTSAHVLDELRDDRVLIAGSSRFLRFHATAVKFTHSRPAPSVDIDVAAIALPPAAVDELAEYYDFHGA